MKTDEIGGMSEVCCGADETELMCLVGGLAYRDALAASAHMMGSGALREFPSSVGCSDCANRDACAPMCGCVSAIVMWREGWEYVMSGEWYDVVVDVEKCDGRVCEVVWGQKTSRSVKAARTAIGRVFYVRTVCGVRKWLIGRTHHPRGPIQFVTRTPVDSALGSIMMGNIHQTINN